MILAGPPRKTNGMKLRQGGLMGCDDEEGTLPRRHSASWNGTHFPSMNHQPLPPVTAAEVRSAALTVCEIVGPNRDAVRETLMALGIDRESLHRGMFYGGSSADGVAS